MTTIKTLAAAFAPIAVTIVMALTMGGCATALPNTDRMIVPATTTVSFTERARAACVSGLKWEGVTITTPHFPQDFIKQYSMEVDVQWQSMEGSCVQEVGNGTFVTTSWGPPFPHYAADVRVIPVIENSGVRISVALWPNGELRNYQNTFYYCGPIKVVRQGKDVSRSVDPNRGMFSKIPCDMRDVLE